LITSYSTAMHIMAYYLITNPVRHSLMHLWLLFLLLGFAGFSAGILDTLAGGGGLIALPTLLATGLPPVVALGTNKLQSAVGEVTASLRFLRHRKFQIKKIRLGLICAVISSSLGALCVQHTNPILLQKGIPFLLLAILIYVLVSPRWLKKKPSAPKLSERTFYLLIGTLIAFYNGFLGPATGSFWAFSFIFFLNYPIVEATIYTKPLNAAGNLTSLFWFVSAGDVYYEYFIVMAIGQLIGAYIAANWVIHKGHWLIRPVLIAAVSIMTIVLFMQNY
jgi:uncharacterized protein